MNTILLLAQSSVPQTPSKVQLGTFFEALVRGGPVMIPLALCSVIAVAWIIERALRMRRGVLGDRAQAEALVAAARDGGPTRALDLVRARPTQLAAIFQPMFERWSESGPALEKAVEDVGSRRVRALGSSLRPFSVIAVTAPLLGLLGTVVGIIIAFRDIALSDAMGKPEALAVGIAQALITTATGLAIAIPVQAAYYWFRARIDRFRRLVEETGEQLTAVHDGRPFRTITGTSASAPPAPSPSLPAPAFPQAAS
jgi:biopolymer transport protein ExbB